MRDYEKAIKELETFKIMAKSESGEMAITMAIEALKRELVNKLTQQAYENGKKDGYFQAKIDQILNTGWIPVSERLPENKETVIVTFKHFVSGNTIGLGSVILVQDKPHWHVREQDLGTYDVLAWMPLPYGYVPETKEEGEEKDD